MKAIGLIPGTKTVELIDYPEPQIQAPDEVKLRVLDVGICGTDREEVSGGRSEAPSGEKYLIIGHEMLGEVVDIGSSVGSVKKGDLAIFTVRRGCGECPCCNQDHQDMCYTGKYKERGIKGLHGYQAEFVVDKEKYLVKVPASVRSFGVLSEPMSIVQKGIAELLCVQKERLPDWQDSGNLKGKRFVVAGLGPVGLLAAIALRLRGAEVLGYDIVDVSSARPQLLREIGGTYIYGKEVKAFDIAVKHGRIDGIVEAAGIPSLTVELMQALGSNGVFALLGVSRPQTQISLDGGSLMKQWVLSNQAIIGSVNANIKHWQKGIEDLEKAGAQWPGSLEKIITHRVSHEHYQDVLLNHSANEIKAVITWS